MEEYLVTKRFKSKTVFGEVNLPYGTVCYAKDNIVYCDKGALCTFNSENFEKYFTRNDDGNAILRRKLIDNIQSALRKDKNDEKSYNERWNKIWNDKTCLSLKRDFDDYFLWDYTFFNADIETLQYIAKLIGIKEVR